MKKLVFSCLILLAATAVLAQDPKPSPLKIDPKLDKIIRDALPLCSDSKVTYETMIHKLPENFIGTVVLVEGRCAAQYLNVVSREGGFYLGVPWFLDDEKTGTLEEKLKQFTWSKLKLNFTPVIDRSTKTRDGLYKVTLLQTTESGNLPLEGEIDPAGTVLFVGHFHGMNEDMRAARLKALEPYISAAPATGASKPAVTVIEFSDFECPSCQHASGYMKPILEKYSDKVRYVRYDLPLVGNHPWAMAAAVGGRAVYGQKAELFWDYKKQVYENQDKLNAFMIDEFARNFAKDHELDMNKYDADVTSPAIRESLMKSVGAAFANDIRSTPTYMVNGVVVEAGTDGKALETYVAGLLK